MIGSGSDHGGFHLKQTIIQHLKEKGYEVKDYGCYCEESRDYPVYAKAVARAIKKGEIDRGISIAANKIPGICAASCSDTFSARAAKEHNHANVLALGERVADKGLALDIVDTFPEAEFSSDLRHIRRIEMIESES